jgi:hypothetical protein
VAAGAHKTGYFGPGDGHELGRTWVITAVDLIGSHRARLRVYANDWAQSRDLDRPPGVDPVDDVWGHGVYLDFVGGPPFSTSGIADGAFMFLSPVVVGCANAADDRVPWTFTNHGTTDIAAAEFTLSVLTLEGY